jgi:hypothetical protein
MSFYKPYELFYYEAGNKKTTRCVESFSTMNHDRIIGAERRNKKDIQKKNGLFPPPCRQNK